MITHHYSAGASPAPSNIASANAFGLSGPANSQRTQQMKALSRLDLHPFCENVPMTESRFQEFFFAQSVFACAYNESASMHEAWSDKDCQPASNIPHGWASGFLSDIAHRIPSPTSASMGAPPRAVARNSKPPLSSWRRLDFAEHRTPDRLEGGASAAERCERLEPCAFRTVH